MADKEEAKNTPRAWLAEITAAEAELKKFHERGRRTNRRFLDERDQASATDKWFNIFYANTNILESALYAQLPKPVVDRKYKDYKDDVARVAALIIERSIAPDLDDPTDLFDSTMRHAVQDRLVPGLAAAWLRLETDTSPVGEMTEGQEAPPQKITAQRVIVDYVFWEDFLWSPCRVWEERRWVGKRAYMDREALVKRFGKDKGNRCPLNHIGVKGEEAGPSVTPKEDTTRKACVYEIWCRTTKHVYWLCKGFEEFLDYKTDPLGLKGFDPCPKPMLANISTSNTAPRPDYYMIQDQYGELDTVNNRISLLIQACKVVGTYDKTAAGVSRMLKEGFDNQLIPVDNWAMFAEKGGIKGAIDWLPLEAVVQALQQLNAAREVIKGQIYELTGIADIVRGASKASETLGAQQIKAQFASVRIKKLQDEVARFASEIMRIKAEIMVKHFDPQILLVKSNIASTDNAEFVQPAMQLLASDEGFEWQISINSDTMSQADYAMEKADRIEFLTSVSQYIAQMGPMLESEPESAPLLLGMLKWAVSAFRGARDIEGMLDRTLEAVEAKIRAAQDQPPEPSPEEKAAQAEAQAEQQKQQAEMQLKQFEAQLEQQKMQQEAMIEQQRAQQEMALKQQEAQLDAMIAQQKHEADMRMQEQQLAFERQAQQQELMFTRIMETLKIQNFREMSDAKLDAQKEQAEAKARASASDTSKS